MKKFLSLILVAVLMATAIVPAFAKAGGSGSGSVSTTVVEVKAHEDSLNAIEFSIFDALVAAGYIKGDEEGAEAAEEITRWQFLLLMLRAATADLDDENWITYVQQYGEEEIVYDDVREFFELEFDEQAAWLESHPDMMGFYKNSLGAILYMMANGYIVGSADANGQTNLNPNKVITFAEAVTIVVRMLGWNSTAMNYNYPQNYFDVATAIGLFDGFGDNTPALSDAVTYEIAAELIYALWTCDKYDADLDEIVSQEAATDALADNLKAGVVAFGFGVYELDGDELFGEGEHDDYVLFGAAGDKTKDSITDKKITSNKSDYDLGIFTVKKGATVADACKIFGFNGFTNSYIDLRVYDSVYYIDDNAYIDGGETIEFFFPEDEDGDYRIAKIKTKFAAWNFFSFDGGMEDGTLDVTSKTPALTLGTTSGADYGCFAKSDIASVPAGSDPLSNGAWYNYVLNEDTVLLAEPIRANYEENDDHGEAYVGYPVIVNSDGAYYLTSIPYAALDDLDDDEIADAVLEAVALYTDAAEALHSVQVTEWAVDEAIYMSEGDEDYEGVAYYVHALDADSPEDGASLKWVGEEDAFGSYIVACEVVNGIERLAMNASTYNHGLYFINQYSHLNAEPSRPILENGDAEDDQIVLVDPDETADSGDEYYTYATIDDELWDMVSYKCEYSSDVNNPLAAAVWYMDTDGDGWYDKGIVANFVAN